VVGDRRWQAVLGRPATRTTKPGSRSPSRPLIVAEVVIKVQAKVLTPPAINDEVKEALPKYRSSVTYMGGIKPLQCIFAPPNQSPLRPIIETRVLSFHHNAPRIRHQRLL